MVIGYVVMVQKIKDLHIPADGLITYLRVIGSVKVFGLDAKDAVTRYLASDKFGISEQDAKGYAKRQWSIEVFHSELNQTCGIARCQAISSRAQRNHIIISILTWIYLAARVVFYFLPNAPFSWGTVNLCLSQVLHLIIPYLLVRNS